MKTTKTVKERLLSKINVNKDTGCWEWTGSKRHRGYGSIYVNGRIEQAHRVSYIEFNGDIPDGMLVCHKCDNPSCINPDHLFVGTPKDNMQDMFAKGRNKNGKVQPHGELNHNAKITEEIVRDIRDSNSLYRELASKYGISVCLVHKIKKHKIWAHII